MAFRQEYIDRFKAVGFYRHVEWKRDTGILVRVFDKNRYGVTSVTFEVGSHDVEYDQRVGDCRQFFLYPKDAVRFMLNSGFNLAKITKIFRLIQANQVAQESLP